MKKNNTKKGKKMDDKVDLKDLNKKKKSLNKPSLSVFKKQKGPKRDEEGKFAVTSGTGGLAKVKDFNWKRAFPLIAVVTLVGGFFVYQSFAASGSRSTGGSSGGFSNIFRSDPTGCQAVPEEYKVYRGAQVPAYQVDRFFQDLHGVNPTIEERFYWSSTRVAELRQELGESKRCQIKYKIWLEIKATTPKMLAEKQKDTIAKQSDVLKAIYVDDMAKSRGVPVADFGKLRAGTSGLAVASSGAYTGKWDDSWPENVKFCATIYSSSKGGKVDLTFYGKQTSRKTVDLASLSRLNEGAQKYQENGRTVIPMGKYEVCSDYNSKRPKVGRMPYSVFSVSVASQGRNAFADMRNPSYRGQDRSSILVEAIYIKK